MTYKNRNIIISFLIMIVLFCAAYLSYNIFLHRNLPIEPGTNSRYYGNISSGGKFGFKVGDNYSVLNEYKFGDDAPIKYEGIGNCTGTYKIISGCRNSRRHISLSMKEFMYHGQLFLELDENNRISNIIWNADLFPLEWSF